MLFTWGLVIRSLFFIVSISELKKSFHITSEFFAFLLTFPSLNSALVGFSTMNIWIYDMVDIRFEGAGMPSPPEIAAQLKILTITSTVFYILSYFLYLVSLPVTEDPAV